MDAHNLQEATDLLFTTLISESLSGKNRADVRKIKSFIRREYEQHPFLEKATIFDADVHVAHRELDLNLVVIDANKVIELNQAFNFQAATPSNTRALIDSWTLKVDKLQQEEGQLTQGEKRIPVPQDLTIVAVTTPPNSNEQKRTSINSKTFAMTSTSQCSVKRKFHNTPNS
ncbi:hypothetical protein UL82_01030 [Corynebacterium kutscheri]|nr:hypothetical protein UL82_01030 [Corynebacterium kutscheri]VEH10831.1 Uncharacterised protein [Corynebacterium kutscheri]